MDNVKSSTWCGKGGKCSRRMSLDLGTLALDAGTSPLTYIYINTWPHVSSSDQSLCLSLPRRDHGVTCVSTNQRELGACGDFTECHLS